MQVTNANTLDPCNSAPRPPFGFGTSSISPFSEVPDMVIPSEYHL